MATFLLKTEPDDFSYDDLVAAKREPWDGVKNPSARMVMRTVKKGDEAFIYHTGKQKAIVGLATIVSDVYADPAFPDAGETNEGLPKAPLFDVKATKRAKTPVTLKEIKADERFAAFMLVKQSRLSVMDVPKRLDTLLRKMAGL